MEPTPTPSSPSALATFLSSRTGTLLLLTAWPFLLGLLGLPTGAAEEALRLYRGETVTIECKPCPECPSPAKTEPTPPSPDASTP